MAWTSIDQMEAMLEGWHIFDAGDGDRIEAFDSPAAQQHLVNNEAAVAFVAYRATIGNRLAERAIIHLARSHNVTDAAITFHAKPPKSPKGT